MNDNLILDKNLEIIEKYNPQLSEKLLKLPYLTNDIQLVETELKEPNLTYNGLFLHNQQGAEKEARDIFAKSTNEKLCINVIFGMGLGYLFKEFVENANGSVILYEPNLEILRVTLELVDFSKEFAQKNIRITSDFKELKSAFEYFYGYKTVVDIMVLDSYKKLYANEINQTVKELETFKACFNLDANLITQNGSKILTSVLNNLTETTETVPLGEFKNIYEGKTGVIISAGSTLDSNIEIIKKYREKIIIFCVGTALKTLKNNEIQPDFVNISEMADVSQQVSNIDVSELNFIIAPYTHTSIQKMKTKNKFLFPSSSTRGALYWSHLTGVDISEYASRGTVSVAALASAKMLGCKKLVLVGQDLAFLNNNCYSKKSIYSFLGVEINSETGKFECKIIDSENYKNRKETLNSESLKSFERQVSNRIKIMNNRMCLVEGISGEMLPTTIDYAMYVDVFKEFAAENQDLELINTSLKGAQIDGFENISLEKALENSKVIEPKDFSSDFKYDKVQILNNLKSEKAYFENILQEFQKSKGFFVNFDKEFKRRNIVTEKAFKDYFSILNIFDLVTEKYFKQNMFYQIIAFDETSQIQHYVSTNQDSESDRIKNIYSLLKIYFEKTETKISKLLEEINNQITNLSNK